MSWKETDPLTVWKNSTIVPIGPNEANVFEHTKPPVSEANQNLGVIQSNRNEIWKSISTLRTKDQHHYFDVLINNWPFRKERLAFQLPAYVTGFTNGLIGMYLSSKIVSFGLYNGLYTRFFDVFRRSNKTPIILAFYASGMTSVMGWFYLVRNQMFEEKEICTNCILARSYAVMAGSGILMPLLTTPWLVQFFIEREGWLNLKPKNILEAFVFNYKYCRSTFPVVPYIFAAQIVIATACVYSLLWSRERIFDTFEVDPNIVRDAIHNREPDTKSHKVHQWLKNRLEHVFGSGVEILEQKRDNQALKKLMNVSSNNNTDDVIDNQAK